MHITWPIWSKAGENFQCYSQQHFATRTYLCVIAPCSHGNSWHTSEMRVAYKFQYRSSSTRLTRHPRRIFTPGRKRADKQHKTFLQSVAFS